MHIECLLSTRFYLSVMWGEYIASDHCYELVHRGIGAIAMYLYAPPLGKKMAHRVNLRAIYKGAFMQLKQASSYPHYVLVGLALVYSSVQCQWPC